MGGSLSHDFRHVVLEGERMESNYSMVCADLGEIKNLDPFLIQLLQYFAGSAKLC